MSNETEAEDGYNIRGLQGLNNSSMGNDTEAANSDTDWGQAWVNNCRMYVIPTFVAFGILFNSCSVTVLRKKRLHLKRSLAKLFAFLNISDM